MIDIVIPAALGVGGVASIVLILRGRRPADAAAPVSGHRSLPAAGPYGPKPLLTAWERRALLALRAQLPTGFYVCPQVRLADMLSIAGEDSAAFRSIAAYSVDFAVIELLTGRVALVVELDDASHTRPARVARDQTVEDALHAVGIPIARFTPADRIDIRSCFGPAEFPLPT